MITSDVKIWTLSNGNECFSFAEREPFERSWVIVTLAIVLIMVVSVEYLLNGSEYSLYPSTFIFVFAFLHWMTIPMKENEKVIERTVHGIMDENVRKDARAEGTDVLKSYVHYDTKGTYAIITGRCFLVLLQNGVVWEYSLVYHKPTEDNDGYYECEKNHVISKNEDHIRAIHPKRWSRFWKKFRLSDKAQLWLLILAIVIIGALSFAVFWWALSQFGWWLLLILGVYVGIYFIVDWFYSKYPNKVWDIVRKILSIPLSVIILFFEIGHPFITITGTYFFVALFAFGIPSIILTAISYFGLLELKPEATAFIVITMGSILCAHSYTATKWMIHQTPLRDWGNHRYEKNREALAVYLIHPSNVTFILYFVYMVYLAVSGYLQIQDDSYLISKGFDAAILKAFLVFIAFTNMRAKAKVMEMDEKDVLKGTMGLFVHDE